MSFVQGKDILRLTDAGEIHPPPADANAWRMSARLAEFTSRLVAGQERDPALWEVVKQNFGKLYAGGRFGLDFEREFQAHMLNRLGYLDNERADAAAVQEALAASQL